MKKGGFLIMLTARCFALVLVVTLMLAGSLAADDQQPDVVEHQHQNQQQQQQQELPSHLDPQTQLLHQPQSPSVSEQQSQLQTHAQTDLEPEPQPEPQLEPHPHQQPQLQHQQIQLQLQPQAQLQSQAQPQLAQVQVQQQTPAQGQPQLQSQLPSQAQPQPQPQAQPQSRLQAKIKSAIQASPQQQQQSQLGSPVQQQQQTQPISQAVQTLPQVQPAQPQPQLQLQQTQTQPQPQPQQQSQSQSQSQTQTQTQHQSQPPQVTQRQQQQQQTQQQPAQISGRTVPNYAAPSTYATPRTPLQGYDHHHPSSPLYIGHNPFIEILRPLSYADDNIVTLNLSHSHIYEIDSDAFVGQRFEHIDLSNNKLGLIHSRSFRIGPQHSRHNPFNPLNTGNKTYPTRRPPPTHPKSVTIDLSHNPAIVALSGAFDHIDVPNCLLNFTNSTVELKFGAFKKYFKEHPGHMVDVESVDCCEQEWLLSYRHNFHSKAHCEHDPTLFLARVAHTQNIIDSCIAYVTSARHSMTIQGPSLIQQVAGNASPRGHSNSHQDNQYLTYLILGGTAMILTSLSIYIIFYMFSLKAAFVGQMQNKGPSKLTS